MSKARFTPYYALMLLASLGFTQSLAVAAENTIEEVVVTADFRARSELETAASVTVMTDTVIKSRAAQHFEELVNAIPNVNYASGSNRARFFRFGASVSAANLLRPSTLPSVFWWTM